MFTPLSGFDSRFLQLLRETIEKQIGEEAMQVASGSAKDMFDYGRKCGHIKGLQDALEVMSAEAKRLMNDGRED